MAMRAAGNAYIPSHISRLGRRPQQWGLADGGFPSPYNHTWKRLPKYSDACGRHNLFHPRTASPGATGTMSFGGGDTRAGAEERYVAWKRRDTKVRSAVGALVVRRPTSMAARRVKWKVA